MEEMQQDHSFEPISTPQRSPSSYHKQSFVFSSIILTFSVLSNSFIDHYRMNYELSLIVIFTLLFLIMGAYNLKKKHTPDYTYLLHHLGSWICLGLLAYVVTLFVNTSALSYQQGAYFIALLLAVTLFSIGLYTNFYYMICSVGLMTTLFIRAHAFEHLALLDILVVITFGLIALTAYHFLKNKPLVS